MASRRSFARRARSARSPKALRLTIAVSEGIHSHLSKPEVDELVTRHLRQLGSKPSEQTFFETDLGGGIWIVTHTDVAQTLVAFAVELDPSLTVDQAIFRLIAPDIESHRKGRS